MDAFICRSEGDGRHGERQTGVAEETLEKERLGRRGSWLTGVEEAGANEPSFTPVGR